MKRWLKEHEFYATPSSVSDLIKETHTGRVILYMGHMGACKQSLNRTP